MLIIKHTVQTTAPVWAVWQILSDVSTWSVWDQELEYSSINGPFVAGTTGKVKFKNSPELPMQLTLVKPQTLWDCTIKLLGARFLSSHLVVESGDKTYVTFTTEVKGPLAFFWAFLIGRNTKKKVPVEMLMMVKKAEELSKH